MTALRHRKNRAGPAALEGPANGADREGRESRMDQENQEGRVPDLA
ncbi:hypothetical protein [Streptomyces sp. KMM 9044]|nr:hypothetical protein [Streptomyces sp. KMM 9044]WAX78129.1 hypothetical protein HUV60_011075 [Streptomyces sp. KMM 9044]